jgi:hypothetical protein
MLRAHPVIPGALQHGVLLRRTGIHRREGRLGKIGILRLQHGSRISTASSKMLLLSLSKGHPG